ncbi:MAG: lipoprotein [Cycloclasticus sp.]
MTRLLKVMLIMGLLAVSAGCGQKGDLYLPTEQVAHYLGL